jgi:hypothetical protein
VTDPASREREATAILDGWNWSNGACLIGGYAVSAYGKPRHSRDLDFVIPATSRDDAVEYLAELGFVIRPLRKPERPDAFLDSITLRRGQVSIDLYIGYVKDKQTQISVPEEWISSNHRQMRLILITGSTRGQVRVCRPEALWVLKLIPGRNQDLGDLFAISSEPVDVGEIRNFLDGVRNDVLKRRLMDESRRLDSDRIFAESQSARFLATSSESARKSWSLFKRRFTEIVS